MLYFNCVFKILFLEVFILSKANFFNDLKYIEKRIIIENKKETDLGITTFENETFDSLTKFIKFIEDGTWSNSKHTRFIVRHFRYKQSELPDLYYASTGERKSKSTFRNQVQAISNMLYTYFGTDFMQAFLQEDSEEIAVILKKISVLSIGDVYFEDLFNSDIAEYITSNSKGVQRYNIDECYEEIDSLCAISKENIRNILSSMDKDKLHYLMFLFRRPLIEQGTLNKEKLDMLVRYTDVLANSQAITNRLNSRSAIEYDEVVFDEENLEVIRDKESVEESYSGLSEDDYARATTRFYGDISFPILNADFFDELTRDCDEHEPTKDDTDEVLMIMYLLHFYQVSFFKELFSQCDQGLLKYILNTFKKGSDQNITDFEQNKVEELYNILDGYDIMDREFNVVISKALSRYNLGTLKNNERLEGLLEKKPALSRYKIGVVRYFYGEHKNEFKDEAESIVKDLALTNADITCICNSDVSTLSIDKLIAQTAIKQLCSSSEGLESCLAFLKESMNYVEKRMNQPK